MIFYLGTHRAYWLGQLDVPLFVSHRTLRTRRSFPKARARWALDSGGFTEISMNGRWLTTEDEYIEAVYRYSGTIGRMDFASPQDWMCEPWIVEKTGLSVQEHQERTVANYLSLRTKAHDLPFVPVLQGWTLDDYHACVDLYEEAGIDLSTLPIVGLGSVCRRQGTREAESIVVSLAARGLQLHGYGMKATGLGRYGHLLRSADSMAWSYGGRRRKPDLHPDCPRKACSNCVEYALVWRERVITRMDYQQTHLAGVA